MAEKQQFGTQVTFETRARIMQMKTEKSNIEMFSTTHHGDVLMMDGEVQFSTLDEHRYHEILVHPAMARTQQGSDILILGGGDGLAARELYKWNNVNTITIVDYDEEFVDFAKASLVTLNESSLSDPRTIVKSVDALQYCVSRPRSFDAIFIDLPDPDDDLYTLYVKCLQECVQMLNPRGTITVQCGGVSLDPGTHGWRVIQDFTAILRRANLHVEFRSIFVPSFMNQWGFLTGYTPGARVRVSMNQHPRLWNPIMLYDRDYEEIFANQCNAAVGGGRF